MASEVLDRGKPNGISVLIAGGGVGGLMTGLECWRRGCDVRIFERSSRRLTTGDSFTIGPTALNSFKNWPFLQKMNEDIAYFPMLAHHKQTGERISGPVDFREMASKEANINRVYRHSRPKFHDMLHEQLALLELEVEYNKEVTDYFEDAERGRAGVVLKDGSRHEADLVVAADGLRGTSWSLVAGQPVPARSSGDAIYRVAYPVEIALADPKIAERFPLTDDGRSVTELWNGEGIHAVFWRNQDEMQWAIFHSDDGTAAESWGQKVDPEEVVKFASTIPGWPDIANRVIRRTPPDMLVDWRLMWRDPQPKWTSPGGHVVQLGDAAHTFLPTSGNGATQAIEDAISLAACIFLGGSTGKVPDATQVHNLLRFERVSCLQAFGVENREKTINAGKSEKKKLHMGKWIFNHDPEKYALENYEAALAHLRYGAPFKNTNIPPGLEYQPWTIDGLLEAQRNGEATVLDGDWD